MSRIAHPGRLLRRELAARGLSASRLALELGVPSGRITDILNEWRAITADTALRLGRFLGNSPPFWLDLQSPYELAVVERERGAETAARIRPVPVAAGGWCRVVRGLRKHTHDKPFRCPRSRDRAPAGLLARRAGREETLAGSRSLYP